MRCTKPVQVKAKTQSPVSCGFLIVNPSNFVFAEFVLEAFRECSTNDPAHTAHGIHCTSRRQLPHTVKPSRGHSAHSRQTDTTNINNNSLHLMHSTLPENHSTSTSAAAWAWHCCGGSDIETNNLAKRSIFMNNTHSTYTPSNYHYI